MVEPLIQHSGGRIKVMRYHCLVQIHYLIYPIKASLKVEQEKKNYYQS